MQNVPRIHVHTIFCSFVLYAAQKEETVSDTSLPIRGGLKRVRREVENMAALLDDVRM